MTKNKEAHPDLARYVLGELDHGLGHRHELVEVLEGLGDLRVRRLRLGLQRALDAADPSADHAATRGRKM